MPAVVFGPLTFLIPKRVTIISSEGASHYYTKPSSLQLTIDHILFCISSAISGGSMQRMTINNCSAVP